MAQVAGIDSSTQSTKIEIRDLDSGEVMARGSMPHPRTTPPLSEQDPASWWSAFESAWQQVGTPSVEAISVAGQQHGMVALDEAGAVIRDAKLWNDTEAAPDAGWLVKQLAGGAADWVAACGSVPVAAFTIAKLSWLHRSEPANWARLAHVLLPHDWITYRLTDTMSTDRGDASGTGYWSPTTGQYCWDLLSIIDSERDWSSVVPPVLGPLEIAGTWRDAIVGPGTGDNMAAALGLALQPGDVVISIGTSGTVYALANDPTADPSGAVAGFADASGRYLPLVCTLNATKVTDTVARLLGVGLQGLDALAMATPLGAGGVIMLPYLDGERTPNRPKATGGLSGLRSDTTREQVARAAFEGVICGLLDGLDALRLHVPDIRRVVMVGGGTRSVAYRQTLADLCDLDVWFADADEAVAAGACVQAAAVSQQVDPVAIAARWGLGTRQRVERTALVSDDLVSNVRASYSDLRARMS
jgi:xylulokinase